MGYFWQRWLVEALENEGCQVRVVDGWRNRGRYRSDGRTAGAPSWSFTPDRGFIWHHTGATASRQDPWPTAHTLIHGRDDLPGPLCQVSPDYRGVVHVVAAGRANHAGETSGFSHLVSGSDGNTETLGCEIDYDGTQPMSRAQYTASIKAAAAYCRRKSLDHTYAYGHHETSVTGKWDPGYRGSPMNMNRMRRHLRECLSYPPGVWQSSPGSSWGKVRVDHLRSDYDRRSESIRKLQYRLKHYRRIPNELQRPIELNGRYDENVVAAVEWWQENVFNEGAPFKGLNLSNRQANALFGNRYHVIEER